MELNKKKPKTFTVTPKIHIVMFHVQEYLKLINTKEEEEDCGLGYMSEPAFEAVYSDMLFDKKDNRSCEVKKGITTGLVLMTLQDG